MKKLYFSFFFVYAFFINAQIPVYVPTQSLAAWYDFSGNYFDGTTNNNHLTPVNSASLTTDRFGNPNSAFAASTMGYLTNTAPSFTLNFSQPFSFSLWVQRTGGTVAFMIGTTAANNFIANFQMGVTNAQFGTNKQQSAWIWAQAAVASANWDHYTCVYDAPNMILYKNGVQVATNVFNHSNTLSTNLPLWIGRGVSGGDFVGRIDEIGFWNRALTASEALLLYLGCPAGFTAQPQSGSFSQASTASLIAPRIAPSTSSQWQIDTGSGFTNIIASPRFSGVTSDTLMISNVDFDLDQVAFRCINEDTICSDTSNVAIITVTCPQRLLTSPLAQSDRVGQSVSFSISSADTLAIFQWQEDDGNGFTDLLNSANVSGANTSTLTLSNLLASQDSNMYRCIVSQMPCADTSDAAMLTVINDMSIFEFENSTIRIFPNPTSTEWTVEIDHSQLGSTFILRDALGKQIRTGVCNATLTTISSQGLSSGVYLLELNDRVCKLLKK